MVGYNIKALKFREELIKLLKRYDCEISGTHIDDGGNMNLSFSSGIFSDYIMQDSSNKYNIIKTTPDEKWENVMDNYIMSFFSDNGSEMAGLNNVKIFTGVITNNKNKAENEFERIYNEYKNTIDRFIKTKDSLEIRLKNGSKYKWLRPTDYSRGYRCRKAIIDRELTLEELHNIVLPICMYSSKDDIKIF